MHCSPSNLYSSQGAASAAWMHSTHFEIETAGNAESLNPSSTGYFCYHFFSGAPLGACTGKGLERALPVSDLITSITTSYTEYQDISLS